MKKYKYLGKSNLSFTHDKKDYLVHGPGPHELPETAEPVKVHAARGHLVEVNETPANEQKK